MHFLHAVNMVLSGNDPIHKGVPYLRVASCECSEEAVIELHLIKVNRFACVTDEPFELSCVYTAHKILQLANQETPKQANSYLLKNQYIVLICKIFS